VPSPQRRSTRSTRATGAASALRAVGAARSPSAVSDGVRVVFLGGLGEIGRNCAVIEQQDRLLVLDCGLMFPDASMPGVDLVLPDFTYLRENAERVDGIVLTHGHEDHIGALSYLLREVSAPVYSSKLALGLARFRLEEAGLARAAELVEVADGERRQIGVFDVEFLPVTHSVPNGFATVFRTPAGVILHTGDWKLDLTPVDGRRTDLARIGAIADSEGVRLLLADSTNSEEPGYTKSESSVGVSLRQIFAGAQDRRIVVACFASHLHRIQQLMDAAIASGRKVALLGRSMLKNVGLARELGLLKIADTAIVDIDRVTGLSPGEICVISTGSQGEPMSALALMASGESRFLTVNAGDLVILSSHAIPGNEWAVSNVIDGLLRRGAEVVHSGVAFVHESGHAKQGEQATLFNLAHPECFVPVHGEYRHLVAHARLAVDMGVDPDRVLVATDGDVLELTKETAKIAGSVPASYSYVDGIVGGVGGGVLHDRKVLAEEGVVVVVVTIDHRNGQILNGPEVITRGWVYAPEAEELLEDARKAVVDAIADAVRQDVRAGAGDTETIARVVRRATGRLVAERTRRRPIIVPVVMAV
jgi:ribonuclease J